MSQRAGPWEGGVFTSPPLLTGRFYVAYALRNRTFFFNTADRTLAGRSTVQRPMSAKGDQSLGWLAVLEMQLLELLAEEKRKQ